MNLDSKYVPKFINKLIEFLDKLESRFPHETDIGILKTAIELARRTHVEVIVRGFYCYVYPHKTLIYQKDEKSLLTNDFNNIINNVEDTSTATLKIGYVKKLFMEEAIDEKTKEVIWLYLILLCRLVEKIKEHKEIML